MDSAHPGASHSLCFRATEEAMFSKMFETRCHQVNIALFILVNTLTVSLFQIGWYYGLDSIYQIMRRERHGQ